MKAAATAEKEFLPSEAPPLAPARVGADELFRAHGAFVARFLYHIGVPAPETEDLAQEVFLIAHRQGGYAPNGARATTWLAEIAIRIASNYRRRRRRSNAVVSEVVTEGDETGATDPPDTLIEARSDLSLVQACLECLGDEHRHVFVLFELDGESCADIARGLRIPVGTVYSRLHHARRTFLDQWMTFQGGER